MKTDSIINKKTILLTTAAASTYIFLLLNKSVNNYQEIYIYVLVLLSTGILSMVMLELDKKREKIYFIYAISAIFASVAFQAGVAIISGFIILFFLIVLFRVERQCLSVRDTRDKTSFNGSIFRVIPLSMFVSVVLLSFAFWPYYKYGLEVMVEVYNVYFLSAYIYFRIVSGNMKGTVSKGMTAMISILLVAIIVTYICCTLIGVSSIIYNLFRWLFFVMSYTLYCNAVSLKKALYRNKIKTRDKVFILLVLTTGCYITAFSIIVKLW